MTTAAAVPPGTAELEALSLPPFGAVTNGLPAASWVPLADLATDRASQLLAALADVGIAACRRPRRSPGWLEGAPVTSVVWVDAVGYALAEDLLRAAAHTGSVRGCEPT